MLALVLRAVRRGGGASCADTHRLHFLAPSGRLRWAPENLSAGARRLQAEHVKVGGLRGAGGGVAAVAAGAECGSGSGWSRRLRAGSLRLGSGGGLCGGVAGAVGALAGGLGGGAGSASARSRGIMTAQSGHRQSRSRSDGWLHTQHRLSAAGGVGVGRIMSAQCSQRVSVLVSDVSRHIRHTGMALLGGTAGWVRGLGLGEESVRDQRVAARQACGRVDRGVDGLRRRWW
jgi:hypothetical protein